MYSPLVTFYTQVYNTKESDLRQCIESVLQQTYTNFQYLILDNGSTDSCGKILIEYANNDARINIVRFDSNVASWRFPEIENHVEGTYLTVLDSDDWIEPNYLEKLLSFTLENALDMACCGTQFYLENKKSNQTRSLSQDLIFYNNGDYSKYYPYYHAFMRTFWGKLIKTEIVLTSEKNTSITCSYGQDTLACFCWLQNCNKVGIANYILHNYRVHSTSVSYKYNSLRFASDIALFQDALDFLKPYGPVSLQNLTFLYIVYCNAVNDTLNVIEKSQLSPKEKLEEYKKIALEPITQGAYQVSDESATNSKGFLFLYMLKNASLVENSQDYLESLSFYLPHCSKVLAMADADLLGQNDAFFQPLLKDDASLLRDNLLKEFKKSPYRSQEKIVNLLSALTDELPVCKTATTHRFINHFFKIYGYLLHSQHLEALEEMTDLLLNHRVKDAQEVFFQVYLTLAALLQQEPAYLFGKIQMAEYLFSAKHYQEAVQIVAELEKMGLSEHDDVVKLKKKLARYLPA